jgi:membrane fusion protein
MSNKNFFREEAIKNKRGKWEGKAMITSFVSTEIVAVFSVVFIISLLFFLNKAGFNRRINVNAEIITVPHAINVTAPQRGVVDTIFLKNGSIVDKGDPIYKIGVRKITGAGSVNEVSYDSINSQMANIDFIIDNVNKNRNETIATLDSQFYELSEIHKRTKLMLDSAGADVKKMKENVHKYDEYILKGLVTKDQANSQRAILYQQLNAYRDLYNQFNQEKFRLMDIKSQKVSKISDFDNQIANYNNQKSELKRKMTDVDQNESIVITSPADGKIESLIVTSGQLVEYGDNLVQLVPSKDYKYYLILWVPNDSVPYINVGDRINIRYEAFPHQKFGQFSGKINYISNVPSTEKEMSGYATSSALLRENPGVSHYKVLVELKNNSISYHGKNIELINGMMASTTIFLEKRSLLEWMFSPLYDVKNNLSGSVD